MNWQDIVTVISNEDDACYSIEDLYQAFKERIMKELVVVSDELIYPAELQDENDS